jgi:type I restriction enzyme S subunit
MPPSAQFLLAHFDRLTEAPGGIAKLRALVLQSAVQGKIIPQNPSDEPTSKRFKKATPKPTDDPLPLNWECWRMLDLVTVQYGFAFDSNQFSESGEGVPLIRIRDIRATSTTVSYTGEFDSSYLVEPGDYLVGMDGDFNIAEWRGPRALLNQRVCRFKNFTEALLPKFLFYCIQQHLAGIHAVTSFVTVKHLSAKQLNTVVLSLPPLAEQRRIVAKVEELMGLCDALEAAQRERETVRTRLRTSALHQLASPDSDSKSAAFILQNLHGLAAAPEDFADIRESVLELAALGQLTRQLPADGPASDLLRRLGNPSAKKRKPVEDEADESEPPPQIPTSWVWTTVGALAAHDEYAITDGPFGANLKTDHYVEQPGHRVIRLQNIGRGYFKEEHRSYLTKEHFERLAKHHVYSGDLVVAGLVDPFVRCCEVPVGIGPTLVKADCYRFKVHPALSSRFVLHYLNSAVCQRFAAAHHHGMTLVRIGLGNFRNIPVPLPPLAEQRRIVAQVDELMAVLDALAAALTAARTTAENLLVVTVAGLQ